MSSTIAMLTAQEGGNLVPNISCQWLWEKVERGFDMVGAPKLSTPKQVSAVEKMERRGGSGQSEMIAFTPDQIMDMARSW